MLAVPLLLVLLVKLVAAARAGEPLTRKLQLLLSGLGGILQALLVPLAVLAVATVLGMRAVQQQGAGARAAPRVAACSAEEASGVADAGKQGCGCKE